MLKLLLHLFLSVFVKLTLKILTVAFWHNFCTQTNVVEINFIDIK